MRAFGVVALLLAGCQFSVDGSKIDPPAAAPDPDPTGGGGSTTAPAPPPTSSTPPPTQQPDFDLAVPPGTDMSVKRVGTPCTQDAQCDPGLFCAKTFFIGLTRIDVPGGYCTEACDKDPTVCPANSFCYSFSFGKYCGSSCPPDPCRKGYQCCSNSSGNGSGDQKACTPDTLCKD